MPKILAFAGSKRRGSLNMMLVQAAAKGAEAAGMEVTFIDLKDFEIPLFDQDLEAQGAPAAVTRLKALFKAHDGLLIATPEYNGGYTPLLKNVIDWVSRPAADEKPLACFTGKIAALCATSTGRLGGIRGLPMVATILSGIGVTVLPQYLALPTGQDVFAADGTIANERTRERIEAVGAKLAAALA